MVKFVREKIRAVDIRKKVREFKKAEIGKLNAGVQKETISSEDKNRTLKIRYLIKKLCYYSKYYPKAPREDYEVVHFTPYETITLLGEIIWLLLKKIFHLSKWGVYLIKYTLYLIMYLPSDKIKRFRDFIWKIILTLWQEFKKEIYEDIQKEGFISPREKFLKQLLYLWQEFKKEIYEDIQKEGFISPREKVHEFLIWLRDFIWKIILTLWQEFKKEIYEDIQKEGFISPREKVHEFLREMKQDISTKIQGLYRQEIEDFKNYFRWWYHELKRFLNDNEPTDMFVTAVNSMTPDSYSEINTETITRFLLHLLFIKCMNGFSGLIMDELYFVVPEEMDDWAGEKCPALGSVKLCIKLARGGRKAWFYGIFHIFILYLCFIRGVRLGRKTFFKVNLILGFCSIWQAVFWRKTMIAFYGAVKLTGAEDEIESINDPILGAATYITVNFCLSVGTAYLAFKDAHKKFLEWGIWEE